MEQLFIGQDASVCISFSKLVDQPIWLLFVLAQGSFLAQPSNFHFSHVFLLLLAPLHLDIIFGSQALKGQVVQPQQVI
jgi:hypothetical protein